MIGEGWVVGMGMGQVNRPGGDGEKRNAGDEMGGGRDVVGWGGGGDFSKRQRQRQRARTQSPEERHAVLLCWARVCVMEVEADDRHMREGVCMWTW